MFHIILHNLWLQYSFREMRLFPELHFSTEIDDCYRKRPKNIMIFNKITFKID